MGDVRLASNGRRLAVRQMSAAANSNAAGAASAAAHGRVAVCDAATGLQTMLPGSDADACCVAADGGNLVTGSRDGTLWCAGSRIFTLVAVMSCCWWLCFEIAVCKVDAVRGTLRLRAAHV